VAGHAFFGRLIVPHTANANRWADALPEEGGRMNDDIIEEKFWDWFRVKVNHEGLDGNAETFMRLGFMAGYRAAQQSVQRTDERVCPMCGLPCGDKPMHIMCDPVSR
jgi:hypothetical protein